jgi:4-hydroxyphenylacetate degradation bifunctional isomerase/decarboxylase decarboxylase subunit
MKHARIAFEGVEQTATERDGRLLLADGRSIAFDDALWLPPLAPTPRPRTILALGLNYADHAKELEFKAPEEPLVFVKGQSTLIGHRQKTRRPPEVSFMHYECELVVVIGKTARNVRRADAYDHIAGYTVANDISMRTWQFRTKEWLQGKMWEASTPVGPALVTSDEWKPGPSVSTTVNGEQMQGATTDDLLFGPEALVAYVSTMITLNPGDLILTGTPGGVGRARTPERYLVDGDVVETSIEGLGTLTNRVVAERPQTA